MGGKRRNDLKIDPEELGLRVAQLRIKMDVSQTALAQMIGCDRSVICNYETGKSLPSIGNALALAETFDVSLDYIVTGKEDTDD